MDRSGIKRSTQVLGLAEHRRLGDNPGVGVGSTQAFGRQPRRWGWQNTGIWATTQAFGLTEHRHLGDNPGVGVGSTQALGIGSVRLDTYTLVIGILA